MITASDLSILSGPVTHFMGKATAFSGAGYTIEIVAPDLGPYSENSRHDIHYLNVPMRTTLSRIAFQFKLAAFLWQRRKINEILYVRLSLAMFLPALWSVFFKKVQVVEINGNLILERSRRKYPFFLLPYVRFLYKLNFKASKGIAFLSKDLEKYFSSHYDLKNKLVDVVGVGVDASMFKPIPMASIPEDIVASYPRDLFHIGFVGYLETWQGLENLLRLASSLKMDNIPFQITIIGEGPEKADLAAKTIAGGLSKEVLFTGSVRHETMPFHINLFDICVIPRHNPVPGNVPMKLYEYLSCGKPVVTSRWDDFFFLEEEQCGQLYDSRDTKNLAEAVLALYHNPKLRKRMGLNGRHLVETSLTWDHITRRLAEKIFQPMANHSLSSMEFSQP